MSQMLSLPEDWDCTLGGLSLINREKIDAIRTAIWELEEAGYITRQHGRDGKGKMTAIEYTILEQPQPPTTPPPKSTLFIWEYALVAVGTGAYVATGYNYTYHRLCNF